MHAICSAFLNFDYDHAFLAWIKVGIKVHILPLPIFSNSVCKALSASTLDIDKLGPTKVHTANWLGRSKEMWSLDLLVLDLVLIEAEGILMEQDIENFGHALSNSLWRRLLDKHHAKYDIKAQPPKLTDTVITGFACFASLYWNIAPFPMCQGRQTFSKACWLQFVSFLEPRINSDCKWAGILHEAALMSVWSCNLKLRIFSLKDRYGWFPMERVTFAGQAMALDESKPNETCQEIDLLSCEKPKNMNLFCGGWGSESSERVLDYPWA